MKKKIAIVGTSFRFPGTTPSQYWGDLLNGKDLVTQVDPSRWAQDSFTHPAKNHPGTSYSFAAGSIGDISGFDAAFFGISPREAAQMDPQQRLLLEMTWEAFENAGMKPSAVRGTQCGVFIGISSADYGYRFAEDLGAVDSSVATGNTTSIAANRISYLFDLKGPSMALDTACSSSMVAFHQACQSILADESSLAIAGGISLHVHPYGFIVFSKAAMLSRRGRCNVFDAAGDGYVRSEGGGIFILKDYERAFADGDTILAVVAASAVNSDGKKSGLTVPSASAQAELLTGVYRRAGIAAADIDYIEAHGTGTAVGDPIETHALGQALGKHRPKDRPLLIGSVKSNLGHLEAASGVAGLVKALHCVQHRVVPATINIKNPNPNIRFEEWNLQVAQTATTLKPTGKLIIGVNSFGFGGANAHVILESPPARVATLGAKGARDVVASPVPLVISAKTPAALKAAASLHARHLNGRRNHYDVAFNAALHRDWHEHRAVVFGSNRTDLAQALARFADGKSRDGEIETTTALPEDVATAFVYSGNGSQWEGMGARLLAEAPVFRDAVRKVDEYFRPLAGFSVEEELAGRNGTGRYVQTEVAQPALFALQVGVTEMLRSRGIVPKVVTGHSVGEIAAAWASGALTLEQAVLVVYQRSRLQGATRGRGQMCAVSLSETEMLSLLEETGLVQTIALAAANSSRGVTVAGPPDALAALEQKLAGRSVFHKRLELDYAFHSSTMDGIESAIYKALATLTPREGHTDYFSTVTGDLLSTCLLEAYYWWQNIRNPVQFEKTIRNILARGPHLFVEIGPHAVLRGYINDCLKDTKCAGRVIATGARGDDSAQRVWTAASQAIAAGVPVEWSRLFPQRGKAVALPNYPWQRERYWHHITPESLNILQRRKVHPLLGYRLNTLALTWENQIDVHLNPLLADHVVGDAVVFPGAAFAELALAAAAQLPVEQARKPGLQHILEIEELEIRAPLLLVAEHSKVVQLAVDAADGGFSVRSRAQGTGEPWTLNAVGRMPKEPHHALLMKKAPAEPRRAFDFDGALHAALTDRVGLHYGPAFRALRGGWIDREDQSILAQLHVPEAVAPEMGHYLLHPALLDCAFQLMIHLLQPDSRRASGIAFVPTAIGRLLLFAEKGTPSLIQTRVTRKSPHSIKADFSLFNAAGDCVAVLRDVRFRSIRLRKDPADHLRLLQYVASAKPHPCLPAPALHARDAQPALADILTAELAKSLRGAANDDVYSGHREQLEPLLDALCSSFAADAIGKLLVGHPAGILTDNYLDDVSRQRPQSAQLLSRLLQILVEDGVVERAEDIVGDVAPDAKPGGIRGGWRFTKGEALPPAQDIWNTLLADHPEQFVALNAIARIGLNLPRLLAGTTTVAELLPLGVTLSTISRHLLGHRSCRAVLHAIDVAVAKVLEATSEGRRLRIVEIGDGPALFAPDLVPLLDRDRCDYTVATTSASTVEDFGHLYDRLPGVHVEQLGKTSADTPKQHASAFELAIVHDDFPDAETAQMAVAHARRHLVDGGVLLWLGVSTSRWLHFVFSADPRWWTRQRLKLAGTVVQFPGGVDAMYWASRLAERQLRVAPVIGLVPDDHASGAYALLAVSDSVAAAPEALDARGQSWLVFEDESSTPQPAIEFFVDEIVAAGGKAVRTRGLSDAATLTEMLLGINGGDGALAGVVHLRGLLGAEDGSQTGMADAGSGLAIQVDRCALLTSLVKVCEQAGLPTTCWVVTVGAAAALLPPAGGRAVTFAQAHDAPLLGFARSLMNEPGRLKVRTIDIESLANVQAVAKALAREVIAPDAEQEVILTGNGERFVPRLKIAPRVIARAAQSSAVKPGDAAGEGDNEASPTLRLGFQFPGQLRNLRWVAHERIAPGSDEIEIDVSASGLNFRDVMYSLGLLSDEAVENGFVGATLGLECAGTVSRIGAGVTGFVLGDRVVAFGPSSFGSRVVTKANAVSHIPLGISFEAAATIPSVFFTAYYAFKHVARLAEGERVLIHGAAGGVGIAAIQLAKHFGAEIFATAGSDEKREFVRLLGADHVFDSRALTFADEILQVTDGEGVDVVLNSLAGEAINRNLRILKPFGRFLELGKRDFYENSKIGLRPFRNNISFFGIDADQLMLCQPALTQRLFHEVMALFAEGILHPLPYRTFEADDVIEAFRHMQQSRQIGKIVVTYRNGIKRVAAAAPQHATLHLPANGTYLVTGGLSGFGLRTAMWLADKGARNLLLVGRQGPSTAEALHAITSLQARGIRVVAKACDITNAEALRVLLSDAAHDLPPLRGVVHAAAVIEDALVRNLTPGQIAKTFAPKILGAQRLHEATQLLKLDFFILFSSATTLFGNPGQASYVAANTYLEAFAAARRAAGMPATCICWGGIADVGFLARNSEIKDQLQTRMGGNAIHSDVALDMLEELLDSNRSNLGVMELDWRALSRFLPTAGTPKFSELAALTSDSDADENHAEDVQRMLAEMNAEELTAAFIDMLKLEIGEILRIPAEKIDANKSIYDMGLDSLMGVELVLAIESRFGIRLPVMALSESPTIARLTEKVIAQLKGTTSADEATAAGDVVSQVQQLAAQHAAEVGQDTVDKFAADMAGQANPQSGRMIH